MADRLKSIVLVLPAVAALVAAAVVWLKARQGEFNSMMGFPLVFAGIITAVCVVSFFVGKKSRRALSVGLLGLAAAMAWGAVWSHHGFFERQRQTLDRQGREAFVGEVFEPIPYLQALNTRGAEPGPGVFPLETPQILVNVWATWCGPCVQEMPMLERFWREHSESGLEIVGVTRLTSREPGARADELVAIAAFLTEHEVSYPILIVDDEVYDLFRPERLPTSLWLEHGKVMDYRVTVEGTESLLETIEARLASG